jgi:hypothetical protein
MNKYVIQTLFFFIIFTFIIGCATSQPPLPATFKIVPPDATVPSDIAAFSGMWEGKLGSHTDIIVIVEKINLTNAEFIISFGGQYKVYQYFTGTVSGSSIEWKADLWPSDEKNATGCPCTLVLSMNKDLNSITCYITYEKYKVKDRADLKRKK